MQRPGKTQEARGSPSRVSIDFLKLKMLGRKKQAWLKSCWPPEYVHALHFYSDRWDASKWEVASVSLCVPLNAGAGQWPGLGPKVVWLAFSRFLRRPHGSIDLRITHCSRLVVSISQLRCVEVRLRVDDNTMNRRLGWIPSSQRRALTLWLPSEILPSLCIFMEYSENLK